MLLRWRPVRQPVLVGAYGWQILSQYRFDGSTPTDAGLQRRRTAGSYRCLERHQAVPSGRAGVRDACTQCETPLTLLLLAPICRSMTPVWRDLAPLRLDGDERHRE